MNTTLEHLETAWMLWGHPSLLREALVSFQNRKLRALVAHAYAKVPYYRRLFDRAGMHPEDIRRSEDLELIPITTKDDLRSFPPEDLIAAGTDLGRLVHHRTSGATGQLFTVRRTRFEDRLLRLFRVRNRLLFGARLGDRIVAVMEPGNEGRWVRLVPRVAPFRQTVVDCRIPEDDLVRELERLRPDILVGYPNVLSHIAHRVAWGRPRGVRPRLVVTGGELLIPAVRKRLVDGFRAPVLEAYGAHEFNLLAWQCADTGHLHVCDDSVVLEVVRDGHRVREGEDGEVVATALHSYAMPFLRYHLGDIATAGPSPCRCGQPFSTLRVLQGRVADYFVLADGASVHPIEVVGPLLRNGGEWIDRLQVVQETTERVAVRIVPLAAPSAGELERVVRMAEHKLPGVSVRVELLASLPPEPSGKFRWCRSLVASDHDTVSETQRSDV